MIFVSSLTVNYVKIVTDPDSLIQIPASEYSFDLFRIDKEFSYTNKGGG